MREERRPGVEETLARLGIEEIEERMEVSPLLAGGDVQECAPTAGDGTVCCSCKFEPPPEPHDPSPPYPPDPPPNPPGPGS